MVDKTTPAEEIEAAGPDDAKNKKRFIPSLFFSEYCTGGVL
jgi:hypothetical protein